MVLGPNGFSSRQIEVWQLLAEGHDFKSIGKILKLSCKTVEWHRAKLWKALGTNSLALLTRAAVKLGLIEP